MKIDTLEQVFLTILSKEKVRRAYIDTRIVLGNNWRRYIDIKDKDQSILVLMFWWNIYGL